MSNVTQMKKRTPRVRDKTSKEICISCGHYIYENQEIELIPLGEKAKGNFKVSARHTKFSDCQTSINIGEPSSPFGPLRSR